jgi:arylformamidase
MAERTTSAPLPLEVGVPVSQGDRAASRLIDLSHVIEHGMVTYKGLPAPLVCDFLSREASRAFYDSGHEFHIGKIEMVGNTGTYLDSPFHRYADGADLAALRLEQLAAIPAVVVRRPFEAGLAVDAAAFADVELAGRAVLVHTGWDRHWRTDRYFEQHPYLTADAASFLAAAGARLVGIDSHNIDDTRLRSRPVHTTLLGAQIHICEHLCNLSALPDTGFLFSAVPAPVRGLGTFPVRAFAELR